MHDNALQAFVEYSFSHFILGFREVFDILIISIPQSVFCSGKKRDSC